MGCADLERLAALSPAPLAFAACSPTGSAMIMESDFAAAEGVVPALSHARICLSVGRPATLYHRRESDVIEGMWRPGEVTVTLAGAETETRVGAMRAIGLAIALEEDGTMLGLDDLRQAARGFVRDPTVNSVLSALRHTAALHGASGAFFDHGVEIILSRLAALNGRRPSDRSIRPLSPSRQRRIDDLIHDRLDTDLSVGELAAAAGMSKAGFSRAWQATTGLPPYAYLTQQRMVRARDLLVEGLSVTQTALTVGYRNPAKFADAYRRFHGVLPGKIRQYFGVSRATPG